ncbi:MAG: 4'-phosphopantetheinyl transferase superfamily protein [Gammaproteobacteria bacterium]|nr:4'-phosphopantetheinyl transferase superfamily protein [Gammaproteobacteria bacterium]
MMLLNQNAIHLWIIELDLTQEPVSEQFILLSTDEKARAERLKLAVHQEKFIRTRASLRLILSKYLGIPPHFLAFDYNPAGKPTLKKTLHSSLHFNLSHSGGLAVIAIAQDSPLGIDLELMKTPYPESIASRFFTPSEQALLAVQTDRARAFYQVWSKKEALIKANGQGLAISLRQFSVTLASHEAITFHNVTWQLFTPSLHPDYQTALATILVTPEIVVYRNPP